MTGRPTLVSACLLGFGCRFDGIDRNGLLTADALSAAGIVAFCPEAAAGMGTPRPRVTLQGGDGNGVLDGRARVQSESGRDVTDAMIHGARLAIEAAHRFGCDTAVLKAHSPSCGVNGTNIGGVRAGGDGVTAAALRAAGLRLTTEETG